MLRFAARLTDLVVQLELHAALPEPPRLGTRGRRRAMWLAALPQVADDEPHLAVRFCFLTFLTFLLTAHFLPHLPLTFLSPFL